MKKVIGIYHSRDLDGICSAAIIKKKYPEAALLGYHYGEDDIPLFEAIKEEKPDLVIMVDVSLPIPRMELMAEMCGNLVWVDHHVSARKDFVAHFGVEELSDYSEMLGWKFKYVYDSSIAACEGLWKYLFPDEEIPLGVQLLGKYDTWRQGTEAVYEMSYSSMNWDDALNFQMGMRLPDNYSIGSICGMLSNDKPYEFVDVQILRGKTILAYQAAQDVYYLQNLSSYVRQWEGLKCLVKIGGNSSSTAFESVWNPELHDLCASCYYDGKTWTYSLSTMKDGVDLSALAKKFGGGGHVKAAGFSSGKFLFQ